MSNHSNIPTWVTIAISLMGGVGIFWTKIKSTIENGISSYKDYKINKNNLDMGEIRALNGRIVLLEKQLRAYELESTRLKSSLNALVPIIKEILKKNPEFEFLVQTLETILNEKNNI